MNNHRVDDLEKYNLGEPELLIHKKEINVLIIYTGGTFGMVQTKDGFKPQNNLLSRLHSYKRFYDKKYSKENYISGTSCTPETWHKQRLRYHLLEYEHLIDSSELNSRHYTKIATTIEENYDKYDSFIIIYGTDTMWYMSSQLSFMLENLNKTVVLTGSQLSIFQWRNDAEVNLIGALTVAEHWIPEVTVFFNGCLFRGNRTIKDNSKEMQPFSSPNFPRLANFDVFLHLKKNLIRNPSLTNEKLRVFKLIERKISLIFIHPLLTSQIFLSTFKKSKGIIIQWYGMGNFPFERKDLIEIIRDAIQKYNKTVVIVSQWKAGFVRSSYSSGVELRKLGVILAEDMTIQAVISKLSYVIGKGYRGKEIEKMMHTNMKGELTIEKAHKPKSVEYDLSKLVSHLTNKTNESTPQDLNKVAEILQWEAFHSASESWDMDAIEKLISNGMEINSKNKFGLTPLHVGVRNNDTKLVEFLLSQENINVNDLDSEGNTPLYYAWFNGNEEISNMLILKGGNWEWNPTKTNNVLKMKTKINDIKSISLFKKAGFIFKEAESEVPTLSSLPPQEESEDIKHYSVKNAEMKWVGKKEGLFLFDSQTNSKIMPKK